ncbi:M28 family metallopeptidase [Phenylobacterium sp. J426]|uniref:M28 family metallopeptidase n=1 Tax=Phenylobacterium sp. J426 TaxID=2898439 RepID=UPI002151BD80|nr:M28 family metallopeptidase [Phenylobacterium sp. J426]MCR5872825.1 M28 family metallopeptidase [Phenylobacterium sp. J426]
MRSKMFVAAAVAVLSLGSAALAQPAAGASSAERIRAHMAFLASDLLEGREAGARGYDVAALYAASQFAQLGLTPAGDDGTYFQKTPMVSYRSADQGRMVFQNAKGVETPLVAGEDFIVASNPAQAELAVSAPLVFVGYGVVAPERGRDDYKGLNVKGKIVVVLDGAPRAFQSEERAYYRSARTKRLEAEKRGAVGFISLYTPTTEKMRPFAESAKHWRSWNMTWRAPGGGPFVVAPKTPGLGTLSVQGAQKLFEGAKAPLDKIYADAAKPEGVTPRFALPGRLAVGARTEMTDSESSNVAALLEGSDPTLRTETVVLSAHLDHEGLREDAKPGEDRVYNGALDNAGGVATTFEVARAFVESGRRPKRSVLFLLVTAEEKGLVGAEYFARNMGGRNVVANVNLDMPILTYDFTDVVAFGADRSSIGPAVRRAAERVGVALSGDPLPDEGLFTRSDHYRFVEVGVPSVFLMTGFQNGGEAKFTGFLKECYHKVCDDLSQPIDYAAGAKFAKINYEIARELSDGAERPAWNRGDFFGGKFGGRTHVADR